MMKSLLIVIAVICAATLAFIAVTTCIAWIKQLLSFEREGVREETRDLREAREDLEDAVKREQKRKAS